MPDQILGLAKIAGITFFTTMLWGATVAFTYWDSHRRGLAGFKVFFWLALVVLLPFIGFTLYLFFSVIDQIFSPAEKGESVRPRRETAFKRPPERRKPLPTIYSTDLTKATVANPNLVFQPGDELPIECNFTIFSGAEKGKEFIINKFPAIIGRGSEVTIRLDADMGVSRKHAEFYEHSGDLRIRDLNSTHGTQVNGIRIKDEILYPGDQIQIGVTVLLVRAVEQP